MHIDASAWLAQWSVLLLVGFALHGCATIAEPNSQPVAWGPNIEGGDCSALVGTYAVRGESALGNSNEWLAIQRWSVEGVLPSLLKYGANRPIDTDAQAVRIQRSPDGRFKIVLMWIDGRQEQLKSAQPRLACVNGHLEERWRGSLGGAELAVWGRDSRQVSAYKAADGALLIENQVKAQDVEVFLFIPVGSRERYRFYWRFALIK